MRSMTSPPGSPNTCLTPAARMRSPIARATFVRTRIGCRRDGSLAGARGGDRLRAARERGDPAFNEPVDGMIHMSTAAIGFSAGENVVYILNTYFGLIAESTRPGVPLALINAFLVTAPLRALLSTIGHITWSGITGWF